MLDSSVFLGKFLNGMGIPATPKKVGLLNHNPQPAVLSFSILSYRPLRFTGNLLIYCRKSGEKFGFMFTKLLFISISKTQLNVLHCPILGNDLLDLLTFFTVVHPLNFLQYSYPICRK